VRKDSFWDSTASIQIDLTPFSLTQIKTTYRISSRQAKFHHGKVNQLIFRPESVFKHLTLLMAIILLALLAGCGSGSISPTLSPTSTLAPTPTVNATQVTISSPSGEVLVHRKDSTPDSFIPASAGMKLEPGDRIKTGANGEAVILFFEGSVMEVGTNSDILIEQLNITPGTGSTTVRLKQFIGNTANRVQKLIDSASTYEVETPAATAVVRGTIFNLQVDESGNTTLRTEEGSVWFTAGGVTVLVGPGIQTSAQPGGIPSTALTIANIAICSAIRGDRDYTVKPGAIFDRGEKVWIYFEVLGFAAQYTSAGYDIWFRTTEARVWDPNGLSYVSGKDLNDYHQTGLAEIPEHSWGTLSFDLLPTASSGTYRVEAEITDIISGSIGSFTVNITVK
jgi:hypothetical protein